MHDDARRSPSWSSTGSARTGSTAQRHAVDRGVHIAARAPTGYRRRDSGLLEPVKQRRRRASQTCSGDERAASVTSASWPGCSSSGRYAAPTNRIARRRTGHRRRWPKLLRQPRLHRRGPEPASTASRAPTRRSSPATSGKPLRAATRSRRCGRRAGRCCRGSFVAPGCRYVMRPDYDHLERPGRVEASPVPVQRRPCRRALP